jgi:hypothetical protein
VPHQPGNEQLTEDSIVHWTYNALTGEVPQNQLGKCPIIRSLIVVIHFDFLDAFFGFGLLLFKSPAVAQAANKTRAALMCASEI